MDTNSLIQLWAIAQQILPPAYIHKAAEAFGWLTALGYLAPKFLAWGLPAATRAAHAVSKVIIRYVPAPVLAYVLPWFINLLDSLTDAMEQIANTFKNQLEADLKKAAAAAAPVAAAGLTIAAEGAQQSTQAAQPSTPPPGGQP